jgi:hypothetical protein
VKGMKLPDAAGATLHAGITLDQCKQKCLSDCSCRAYAAANVGGGVSRDCVIWDVDLLDMRQFPTVLQDATPQVLTTFTPISFDFSLNSACSSYRN